MDNLSLVEIAATTTFYAHAVARSSSNPLRMPLRTTVSVLSKKTTWFVMILRAILTTTATIRIGKMLSKTIIQTKTQTQEGLQTMRSGLHSDIIKRCWLEDPLSGLTFFVNIETGLLQRLWRKG
jgi:hypothetical protein